MAHVFPTSTVIFECEDDGTFAAVSGASYLSAWGGLDVYTLDENEKIRIMRVCELCQNYESCLVISSPGQCQTWWDAQGMAWRINGVLHFTV